MSNDIYFWFRRWVTEKVCAYFFCSTYYISCSHNGIISNQSIPTHAFSSFCSVDLTIIMWRLYSSYIFWTVNTYLQYNYRNKVNVNLKPIIIHSCNGWPQLSLTQPKYNGETNITHVQGDSKLDGNILEMFLESWKLEKKKKKNERM